MKNYVTINSKNAKSALDWAKKNCPTYITNDFHMTNYESYDLDLFDFFFDKSDIGQQEMLMFALVWS